MNRQQKIHSLKVIKESFNNFRTIIHVEKIKGKDIYLTPNRLEIAESIRSAFFKDAILFVNVSKQFTPEAWIKIPE
jgi:hypothetical protein